MKRLLTRDRISRAKILSELILEFRITLRIILIPLHSSPKLLAGGHSKANQPVKSPPPDTNLFSINIIKVTSSERQVIHNFLKDDVTHNSPKSEHVRRGQLEAARVECGVTGEKVATKLDEQDTEWKG